MKTQSGVVVELLGINPESPAVALIEGSIEAIPYIGKVLNAYKMHRLQQRIERMEVRLAALAISLSESTDEILNNFIRKRVFPHTLHEMLEEEEEEKIDLIMNGLEYIYNQEVREESKVLVYFDVLRELRVEEIKELLKFKGNYRGPSNTVPPKQVEDRKKFNEDQGYASYIFNHLEKLGLIDTGIRNMQENVSEMMRYLNNLGSSPYKKSFFEKRMSPSLTKFGRSFIEFFELSVLYRIPAE